MCAEMFSSKQVTGGLFGDMLRGWTNSSPPVFRPDQRASRKTASRINRINPPHMGSRNLRHPMDSRCRPSASHNLILLRNSRNSTVNPRSSRTANHSTRHIRGATRHLK